jgi:hypothetical protein
MYFLTVPMKMKSRSVARLAGCKEDQYLTEYKQASHKQTVRFVTSRVRTS